MPSGNTSSLFYNESMPDDMRQRRQIRTSHMGEPVPPRVEKQQPKPAREWTKAIVMSIASVTVFVMFALRSKNTYLARKTSDFTTYSKCDLETYPLWKIDEAIELNLSDCQLNTLPDNIEIWSRFKSLKKLDLNSNSLVDLPMAMEAISETIEILFLSENKFNKVPDVIKKMNKLRVLSMRGNFLTELSSENLPVSSLVWLILTNNKIASINDNVSNLLYLRKLMLSHNELDEIPEALGKCEDLELVRLADNEIEKIPTKMLLLPRLGWISLSGNPIFSANKPSNGEKIIKEKDIEINKSKILGQGASGVVYSGKYQGEDVAVKVFKEQSKGSDGNPDDEMSINSIIDNANAISAIGVIEEDGKKVMLVMKLLQGTSPLGIVPNFDTVTRDAGPAPLSKTVVDKNVLLRAIWNIASALEYIHSDIGVSHGDVYLHNVLIDGDKVSRLSDWGASFAYDKNFFEQADLIERIEALAFGRLIEDILAWHPTVIQKDLFEELLAEILQPDVSKRPGFKTIREKLSLIPDMADIVDSK